MPGTGELSLVADELRKRLSPEKNGRNWLYLADAKSVMTGRSILDVATEAVSELLAHTRRQGVLEERGRIMDALDKAIVQQARYESQADASADRFASTIHGLCVRILEQVRGEAEGASDADA